MNKLQYKEGMEKIEYALDSGKRLEFSLPVYTMKERKYLDFLLGRYLERCGLTVLQDRLLYCLHEIGGNAHKANIKRLFLEEYSDMDLFKDTVSREWNRYCKLLVERDRWIRFRFHLSGHRFTLQVINNSPLLPEEEERIREKMAIAARYHTLADAYPAAEDFTEGAGLGIVMIHVMLKAIGFSRFHFSVDTRRSNTITTLQLDINSWGGALLPE